MRPTPIRVLAAALGAAIQDETPITEICTDSRTVTPGSLFVCIEGERLDGHDFAGEALSRGAAAIVARRPLPLPAEKVFYVPDTMDAHIALSSAYREQFSLLSVGITGSVGKTTTKEFTACVLETRWRTHKTEGNKNNEIGLPQTLFALDESAEALVAEMGMDKQGDIDKLAAAVQPDAAVITHIGTSHIEKLGSRENILQAKLEVTRHLPAGAPLILSADCDLLRAYRDSRLRVIHFGLDASDADYQAQEVEAQETGTRFVILHDGEKTPAFIPALGQHNVRDALAAFAVGCELGIRPQEAAKGLRQYAPSGMRQRRVQIGGITVMEDCYNASPDSMCAALFTLRELPVTGERIAVFGDMLELGETSREAHQRVGRLCREQRVDRLYGFGQETAYMVEAAKKAGLRQAEHFTDKGELARRLADSVRDGDFIWVKASRSMRFEEILEEFYRLLKEKQTQE
ncbi:MAG: UDP-N-acetylmuramoyl-tripeptide--D-alanyl-D-alanine ligase [Provencibacterium sp.]|nr:UDP-N-acetylmuramoyl-tripeptide--D-alanyl-D-alanine ligase [Provencibacterium sp.]